MNEDVWNALNELVEAMVKQKPTLDENQLYEYLEQEVKDTLVAGEVPR